jgi:hypothetical protein
MIGSLPQVMESFYYNNSVTIQGVEGGERPAQNARPESRTLTPGVPETVKR